MFDSLAQFALTAGSSEIDYSGVTSAVQTGLESVASAAGTMITGIVPAALGVAGLVLVVGIGMRVFKRIAGR